jgi:hypothetical protein
MCEAFCEDANTALRAPQSPLCFAPTEGAMAHDAKEKDDRKARLAQALRANLQRRKSQARSRRTGEADKRPEGLAAAKEKSGS